jgi:hypothetical protein
VHLFEVERESKLVGDNAAQRKEAAAGKELLHRQRARLPAFPDNPDDGNVALPNNRRERE